MAHPFVDTDVIIRLLTGDDPDKQQAARKLFEQVAQGTLTLAAPDTVIADAVFVLLIPHADEWAQPGVGGDDVVPCAGSCWRWTG